MTTPLIIERGNYHHLHEFYTELGISIDYALRPIRLNHHCLRSQEPNFFLGGGGGIVKY